jgi:hypothetical protein
MWEVWQVELSSEFRFAWNFCMCFPVSGLMRANLHPVHMALTVLKAACTSIKLGSGSGSLLPSPLLRLQHLTLGRSEVLRNLPIQAGYCYYTFRNIAWFHYFFPEMILQADHYYCTFQRNHFTFAVFFLRNEHSRNTVRQDQEFWMNDVGKRHFEEHCIRYNYTLVIWVIYRVQKKWMILVGKQCMCFRHS